MPARKDSNKNESAPSYEEALRELEAIVMRIENGSLSLEETIASYERGMQLSLRCHDLLQQAQQKVEHVARTHGIATDDKEDDAAAAKITTNADFNDDDHRR